MDASNDSPDDAVFEREIAMCADGLRGALLATIRSLGLPPDKSQTIARRLGLRKSLAWSLVKIVSEGDPYVAVSHIPGQTGMRLAIEAFRSNGADVAMTDATERESERFYRLIETHVGDRRTLMSILGEMWPERLQEQRESDRKLAFQGNSAIWGVQTRVSFAARFSAPNPESPDMVDLASVRGLLGLRRMRRTSRWPLWLAHAHNDDGTVREFHPTPLDPSLEPDDAPLLTEHCTKPLEGTRLVRDPPYLKLDMTDGPVGSAGAIDFVMGHFSQKFASLIPDEKNRYGEFHIANYTPAELQVVDLLMHRDLPVVGEPEAKLFGRIFAGAVGSMAPQQEGELPLHERMIDLGRPPSVSTVHIPGYASMLQVAFDRLNWQPGDFRGYRLIMRYPPIPTGLRIRYRLAEPT
jgi:hypothetical protein